MKTFELIRTESVKENGTFVEKETVRYVVDQEYLDNCTNRETIQFFRRLGGKEFGRTITGATGKIYLLESISPCGMFKTNRRFTPIK